jgi:hypothetical protein
VLTTYVIEPFESYMKEFTQDPNVFFYRKDLQKDFESFNKSLAGMFNFLFMNYFTVKHNERFFFLEPEKKEWETEIYQSKLVEQEKLRISLESNYKNLQIKLTKLKTDLNKPKIISALILIVISILILIFVFKR